MENQNENMNEKVNEKYESESVIVEIESFMESEREYVYNGLRVVIDTFLNRLQVHNKVKKQIICERYSCNIW